MPVCGTFGSLRLGTGSWAAQAEHRFPELRENQDILAYFLPVRTDFTSSIAEEENADRLSDQTQKCLMVLRTHLEQQCGLLLGFRGHSLMQICFHCMFENVSPDAPAAPAAASAAGQFAKEEWPNRAFAHRSAL